jgi:hypothetical protein
MLGLSTWKFCMTSFLFLFYSSMLCYCWQCWQFIHGVIRVHFYSSKTSLCMLTKTIFKCVNVEIQLIICTVKSKCTFICPCPHTWTCSGIQDTSNIPAELNPHAPKSACVALNHSILRSLAYTQRWWNLNNRLKGEVTAMLVRDLVPIYLDQCFPNFLASRPNF